MEKTYKIEVLIKVINCKPINQNNFLIVFLLVKMQIVEAE